MAEKLDGKTLGPFTIVRRLGAGAMGVVWLADHNSGVRVALKMMNSGAALASADGRARFEREANILRQLKHPNIVRLFGIGKHEGWPYYAMERVPGETLADRLERRGRLAWQEVVELVTQLCAALRHAHDQGVVHRDLKPSNLMITKEGVLKLADFGIAKDLDVTQLTSAHSAVGTAAYMAPEQCRGVAVGPQADLYALGVVLFELLTGRKPFQAESSVEMFQKHLGEKPPRASSICLDVPHFFDILILHLMEKDPDNRPPNASVVATSLAQIQEKINTLESAGVNAARSRRMDRRTGAMPVDARDKEAARLLRGGKSRRRKGLPVYRSGWFVSLLLCALVVVCGSGLWWLFGTPSAETLATRAEALLASGTLDDVEAVLSLDGPVQAFLAHHEDASADTPVIRRIRAINDWARTMDAQRILRIHARTRGNKLKVEPSDAVAAKAFAALDREDEGKLPEAALDWQALAGQGVPWGGVAAFHLTDFQKLELLLAEFDKRWQQARITGRLPVGLPAGHPLARVEGEVWRGLLAEDFGDSALAYHLFDDAKKKLAMEHLDAQFFQPDRLARRLFLLCAQKTRLSAPADEPERRQGIFDTLLAKNQTALTPVERATLAGLALVYENEPGFEVRSRAIRALLPEVHTDP